MTPTSLIVPTLRRPDFLRRCLASIEAQTVQAASVLVGIRPNDGESLTVVREFSHRLPVKAVEARGVGVIGSMSSCLAETTEEFILLVDDDVELPPRWLEIMLGHLQQHADVIAAAGRDFLQDHPEMRRTEKRVEDVGTFHWYGRITGNHHRGGGGPRCVDILRGSNCLFRGDFLREVGFEQRLRGNGAQVNWELALAFQAMQRQKRFFYDPTVEVVHHVAPRHDLDSLHRGGFNFLATHDNAYNETFVISRYAPGLRKWTGLTYQLAIGSSLTPGLVRLLLQLFNLEPYFFPRLKATALGRVFAIWDPRARAVWARWIGKRQVM